MGRTWSPAGVGAALAAAVAPTWVPAGAQTPLTSVRVASGLSRPLFVTHAPGDFTRVFILEQFEGQTGRIRVLDLQTGVLRPTPFLSVAPVTTLNEQGLLGLAFHPQYGANGLFYIYYTRPGGGGGGDAVIERYRVSKDPNVADPASAQPVLVIAEPSGFHNGGWLGFGPEGFLYAAIGDGGPVTNAQATENNLLGKILRVDVNGDDFPLDPSRNYAVPPTNPFAGAPGDDEIWAYGLRNPWRCAFDRQTHDLWIADVGFENWEEIDFQPASGAPPHTARNYGWSCTEGFHCTGLPTCACGAPQLVAPIHEYGHGGTPFRCSITGGYVYRGCAIPDLRGAYFFADFCAATIWTLRYDGTSVTELTDRTAELAPGGGLDIRRPSSFGEDAFGELYICDHQQGEVFRIVPGVPALPDCNANGRRDECDILAGYSLDANANGIPDECECYPNCDRSPVTPYLSVNDYICFQTRFALGDPYADCDGNGQRNVNDYICFQTSFALGC